MKMVTKTRALTLLTCVIILQAQTAFAWVFPEHRDIVVLAVQRLSPEQQALLQKLWSEARAGHEPRLCERVADAAQGPNPDCIDYASWAAISGDHSCSARDMLGIVLDAPWIVGVAQVSTPEGKAGRRPAARSARQCSSRLGYRPATHLRNTSLAQARTMPTSCWLAQKSTWNHFLTPSSHWDPTRSSTPDCHSDARRAADQRYPDFPKLAAGGISNFRIPPLPDLFSEPELRPDDSASRRVRQADEILSRVTDWCA
jgi:hypothetical protein